MTDKPNNRNLYAVVGMGHRDKSEGINVEAFLRSLPNDHPVVLVREPQNKFDRNAVQVWVGGRHVGFVPKTQNAVLSKFIETAGTTVTERQKLERSTGIISLAMDEAGTVTIAQNKAVDAKLHWGRNEVPLVEV